MKSISFRHPKLVEGSVVPVAAVYDRRIPIQSVAVARRAAVHREAEHLSSPSVILSVGEPENLLFSQDLPEPKSKDLVYLSAGFEKRERIRPHVDRPTQIARRGWANLPRVKKVLSLRQTLVPVRARSFDCGSGSSFGKTTSFDSPSLRMTEVFSPIVAQGGTR